MSYDIDLNDPVTKEVIKLDTPHHMAGGTYALGGTKELWLNVTYNYANHFYNTMGKKRNQNHIRQEWGRKHTDSGKCHKSVRR